VAVDGTDEDTVAEDGMIVAVTAVTGKGFVSLTAA